VASREDWGILALLIIGKIVALVSNAITDFIELEVNRQEQCRSILGISSRYKSYAQ
jgi:hypothetical protein